MIVKILVVLVLSFAAHILPLPFVIPGMMYNHNLSRPLWYAVMWRQAEHLAGLVVVTWKHGLFVCVPGAILWAISLCAFFRITSMLHGDDYDKKHVPRGLKSICCAFR